MSLIRPEAAQIFARWHEAIIGAAVLCLGLYWGLFTGGGLLHWIGYAVAICGVILLVTGLQRGRFRVGGGGQGVVSLVEGRVTYFGPTGGGAIDLNDLSQLSIIRSANPPHWCLEQTGLPPLTIPLDAEGADLLFDAFAHLPDLQTERMLRQMQSPGDHATVIWRKPSVRTSTIRLH